MTPREAEVLFWVSQGKSNHDIGVILGAKIGHVCKHVEHILSKLNVENRTAAAVIALETVPARPRRQPTVNLVRAWAAISGFITSATLCLVLRQSELYGEIGRLFA